MEHRLRRVRFVYGVARGLPAEADLPPRIQAQAETEFEDVLGRRELNALANMAGRDVQGLILNSSRPDDKLRLTLEGLKTPCILFERLTYGQGWDNFGSDDYQGALEAMRHLLDLGHERIGLVMGFSYPSHTVHFRRKAWEDGLRAAAGLTARGPSLSAESRGSGIDCPTAPAGINATAVGSTALAPTFGRLLTAPPRPRYCSSRTNPAHHRWTPVHQAASEENMLAWLWSYLRKHIPAMGIGLFFAAIVCALNMVNPKVSGAIVDQVLLGGRRELLGGLVAIMIGTTLLKAAVRYTYQMSFEHLSQNIIRRIREDLYAKVQGLDWSYFDKTKSGDVMTLMTSDLDAVRHFIAWVIYMSFEMALVFSFSVSVLLSINAPFALSLLTVSPFIGFFAVKLAKAVKPTHLRVRDQFSRLNSLVQENIGGNRVVKAFVREAYEERRFTTENHRYRDRNLESTAVRIRYMPLIDALANLMPVILITVGGVFVIRGSLTLGELVTFNGLMWAITNPLNQLGSLVNDYQRFAASAERIYGLFQRESRMMNPTVPFRIGRAAGNVEFRQVDFDYGDGPVLRDIDLKIEEGMTVGILGPTGSGKSSLVRLISRYYDVSAGTVLLDGRDVKTLDLQDLRRNVGMAMQDVFLFSDTIEGNIRFAKPDAADDAVRAAALLADADNFIKELPQGYDTVVGERGVGLSGGQRQRIALARLFLADPPVMILDDTSSSVDVETEERIRSALLSYSGRRTIFLIAHRLSTLQRADLILVLNDGRIVDHGKHAELLERGGYYREVWNHQSAHQFVVPRQSATVGLTAAEA